MEAFQLAAGTALALEAELQDGNGQPLSYEAPGPALSARVWPGGARALSFLSAASWVDPTAGTVLLTILPSQTASLPAGRYRAELLVTDPVLGPTVAAEWSIDLVTAAAAEPEPPSYNGLDDMTGLARGWLREAQDDGDEAGFARERGRARAWLEERIAAGLALAWDPFGRHYRRLPVSADYIRHLLREDLLIVRPWVVEAAATKAVALVCLGELGGDNDDRWLKRAAVFHNRADDLALAATAEIATVAGGPPTIAVHLGNASVR